MGEQLMVLTRIGVWSAAKVMAVWYAAIGLIMGFFFAAFALLGGMAAATQGSGSESAFGAVFGVGAIVLMPLVYGFLGLVLGALGAALFNVISGFVDGLELHFDARRTPDLRAAGPPGN